VVPLVHLVPLVPTGPVLVLVLATWMPHSCRPSSMNVAFMSLPAGPGPAAGGTWACGRRTRGCGRRDCRGACDAWGGTPGTRRNR